MDGSYLTEISEQTLESGGKSGAAIAKKMFLVLNSSKFPKELADMLQAADPQHAADFIADMATVFAKTNLHSREMRKILQMKWIYDSTRLRALPSDGVMTAGLIMENLSKLSGRGPRAQMVIRALSYYANEAVDDVGNLINSKYHNAFIAHGRRAEVDLFADAPASFIFGGRIELETVFTKNGGKASSDVDGAGRLVFNRATNAFEESSGPMTAISVKRAGRTANNFFTEDEKLPWHRSDGWIRAYLTSIKKGTGEIGDGNYIPPCEKLLILTGNGLPDASIMQRINNIAEELEFDVEFDFFKSAPPPSN